MTDRVGMLPQEEFRLRNLPGVFRLASYSLVSEGEVHVVIEKRVEGKGWLQAWRGPVSELKREIVPEKYYVKRQQPRGWGIFRHGSNTLVEGGFFYQTSALNACARWNEEE